MSLFPAYFGVRKTADDEPAPAPDPGNESRADIFNLIPPRADSKYERQALPASEKPEPQVASEVVAGRNVHPVTAMDLTRLSIDNDGRLYWDGKPVEVRRKLMMSRGQVVGASLLASVIVAGAVSSAIQAAETAHTWACRAGWANQCAPASPAVQPRTPRLDIPA